MSGGFFLRIQPELLRGGRVRVVSSPAPSLAFPVKDAKPQSIRSVFGDARDAGSGHQRSDGDADLVEAALVQSANDAAWALAAHVGKGDVGAFVRLVEEAALLQHGDREVRVAADGGLAAEGDVHRRVGGLLTQQLREGGGTDAHDHAAVEIERSPRVLELHSMTTRGAFRRVDTR